MGDDVLADYFAREASALQKEVKAKADAHGAASLTTGQTNRVLRILRTAVHLTNGDPSDVVDVELTDVGQRKIQVIKAIRKVKDLGLKEAKDLADRAPALIAENVDTHEADRIKEALEGQGAEVSYR